MGRAAHRATATIPPGARAAIPANLCQDGNVGRHTFFVLRALGHRCRALPVVVCLASVAASCAAVDRARFPGAVDRAIEAPPPPGAIVWSAPRRLTWSDFAGEPDSGSGAAALTTYLLSWQAGCDRDGFSFRVASAFLPDQSWVKPAVLERPAESRRALGHEQTHFDISEVQARKMRRALSRLVTPCTLTEEQLAAAIDPIVREDADLQGRYDRETDHGLDVPQQVRWDDDVRRELEALGRYATTDAVSHAARPGGDAPRSGR